MTRADRRPLALALVASAAVVVLSPWVGEARSWLRREVPAQFSSNMAP